MKKSWKQIQGNLDKPSYWTDFEEILSDIARQPEWWCGKGEGEKHGWAMIGASYLVLKIERQIWPGKQAVWGFWKRVKKAESAAIEMTRVLGNQALDLQNASLFAYWTRVRGVLREGSYHG